MSKVLIIGTLVLALLFGINYYEQNIGVNEDVFVEHHEVVAEEWLSYSGMISNISWSSEHRSVFVSNEAHDLDSFIFFLGEEVLLLDEGTKAIISFDDLVEGDLVTAYYGSHTPMLLSMPPQMSPAIFVVNVPDKIGFIKVSYFDSDLISKEGSLKLNIGSDTELVDQTGNEVVETDLYNQDLVVFYTASTRSIPAQTVPEKIILLTK